MVLTEVIKYLSSNWLKVISKEIKPFYNRREELSVESDILLWGYRTVIPSSLTRNLMDELHGSHMGIVKLKS